MEKQQILLKPEWLQPGAFVMVDVETTSALLDAVRRLHAENERLRRMGDFAVDVLEAAMNNDYERIKSLNAAARQTSR